MFFVSLGSFQVTVLLVEFLRSSKASMMHLGLLGEKCLDIFEICGLESSR